MTPRDLGLVIVSALACVFGVHEAWSMREETKVARIELDVARAEVESLIALRTKAEAWLASAPAGRESGTITSAAWIAEAKRRGLAVSRVSAQGENWSVSVEGPLSGVAQAITAQTEAVSIRPGALPGHVHAEFTMAGRSRPIASLSKADLGTLLAEPALTSAVASETDSGLRLVFRSEDAMASLPRARAGAALLDMAGARTFASLPMPVDLSSASASQSVPYDYLGRIEGGTRGVCGVFKSVENGLVVSVRQGETLGEWKLVRVSSEEVVFAAAADPSRTVKLARRIQSASS